LLLRIGTVLAGEHSDDQYEIRRFIGNGMNGEVYEVLDQGDGSIKAVKVSSDALMLEREAEAAKRITHPNVTRYFEYREAVVDDSKIHCIVMEFVPDGDMRKRINKQLESGQFFALDLLLDWMSQLASGLCAINSSLIHRDLKPENILFLGDTAKVSDFGLSKYVEEATRTKTYKGEGTYPYMAPETWELAHQGIETDIYSLGIIFYELVTLQRPFEAQNWLDWSHKHKFALPPKPLEKNPEIGYAIDGMIRKMMEKEPSKRYSSAEEILRVTHQQTADTAGGIPNIIPDSLVAAAIQKHDAESKKTLNMKLEQDKKQELSQKFDYGFGEILEMLDNVVDELNEKIQVEPIERKSSPKTATYPTAFYYDYFDRRLVIEALPLIEEVSRLLPVEDKNKIEEKGVIGAACLYLVRKKEIMGGINFILTLEQGKMYGNWKTCEIRDHAFVGRQHPYQPFAVVHAKDLLRDLLMHWGGVMDIHTVSIKDFSQDDFMPFFQELVSV
jgi:serine/threonine protein kinase